MEKEGCWGDFCTKKLLGMFCPNCDSTEFMHARKFKDTMTLVKGMYQDTSKGYFSGAFVGRQVKMAPKLDQSLESLLEDLTCTTKTNAIKDGSQEVDNDQSEDTGAMTPYSGSQSKSSSPGFSIDIYMKGNHGSSWPSGINNCVDIDNNLISTPSKQLAIKGKRSFQEYDDELDSLLDDLNASVNSLEKLCTEVTEEHAMDEELKKLKEAFSEMNLNSDCSEISNKTNDNVTKILSSDSNANELSFEIDIVPDNQGNISTVIKSSGDSAGDLEKKVLHRSVESLNADPNNKQLKERVNDKTKELSVTKRQDAPRWYQSTENVQPTIEHKKPDVKLTPELKPKNNHGSKRENKKVIERPKPIFAPMPKAKHADTSTTDDEESSLVLQKRVRPRKFKRSRKDALFDSKPIMRVTSEPSISASKNFQPGSHPKSAFKPVSFAEKCQVDPQSPEIKTPKPLRPKEKSENERKRDYNIIMGIEDIPDEEVDKLPVSAFAMFHQDPPSNKKVEVSKEDDKEIKSKHESLSKVKTHSALYESNIKTSKPSSLSTPCLMTKLKSTNSKFLKDMVVSEKADAKQTSISVKTDFLKSGYPNDTPESTMSSPRQPTGGTKPFINPQCMSTPCLTNPPPSSPRSFPGLIHPSVSILSKPPTSPGSPGVISLSPATTSSPCPQCGYYSVTPSTCPSSPIKSEDRFQFRSNDKNLIMDQRNAKHDDSMVRIVSMDKLDVLLPLDNSENVTILRDQEESVKNIETIRDPNSNDVEIWLGAPGKSTCIKVSADSRCINIYNCKDGKTTIDKQIERRKSVSMSESNDCDNKRNNIVSDNKQRRPRRNSAPQDSITNTTLISHHKVNQSIYRASKNTEQRASGKDKTCDNSGSYLELQNNVRSNCKHASPKSTTVASHSNKPPEEDVDKQSNIYEPMIFTPINNNYTSAITVSNTAFYRPLAGRRLKESSAAQKNKQKIKGTDSPGRKLLSNEEFMTKLKHMEERSNENSNTSQKPVVTTKPQLINDNEIVTKIKGSVNQIGNGYVLKRKGNDAKNSIPHVKSYGKSNKNTIQPSREIFDQSKGEIDTRNDSHHKLFSSDKEKTMCPVEKDINDGRINPYISEQCPTEDNKSLYTNEKNMKNDWSQDKGHQDGDIKTNNKVIDKCGDDLVSKVGFEVTSQNQRESSILSNSNSDILNLQNTKEEIISNSCTISESTQDELKSQANDSKQQTMIADAIKAIQTVTQKIQRENEADETLLKIDNQSKQSSNGGSKEKDDVNKATENKEKVVEVTAGCKSSDNTGERRNAVGERNVSGKTQSEAKTVSVNYVPGSDTDSDIDLIVGYNSQIAMGMAKSSNQTQQNKASKTSVCATNNKSNHVVSTQSKSIHANKYNCEVNSTKSSKEQHCKLETKQQLHPIVDLSSNDEKIKTTSIKTNLPSNNGKQIEEKTCPNSDIKSSSGKPTKLISHDKISSNFVSLEQVTQPEQVSVSNPEGIKHVETDSAFKPLNFASKPPVTVSKPRAIASRPQAHVSNSGIVANSPSNSTLNLQERSMSDFKCVKIQETDIGNKYNNDSIKETIRNISQTNIKTDKTVDNLDIENVRNKIKHSDNSDNSEINRNMAPGIEIIKKATIPEIKRSDNNIDKIKQNQSKQITCDVNNECLAINQSVKEISTLNQSPGEDKILIMPPKQQIIVNKSSSSVIRKQNEDGCIDSKVNVNDCKSTVSLEQIDMSSKDGPDLSKSRLSKSELSKDESELSKNESKKSGLSKYESNESKLSKYQSQQSGLSIYVPSKCELSKYESNKSELSKDESNESELRKYDSNEYGLSEYKKNESKLSKYESSTSGIHEPRMNKSNSSGSESGKAGINKSYASQSEFIVTEMSQSELRKSDLSNSYLSKCDLSKSRLRKSESSKFEPSNFESSESDLRKLRGKITTGETTRHTDEISTGSLNDTGHNSDKHMASNVMRGAINTNQKDGEEKLSKDVKIVDVDKCGRSENKKNEKSEIELSSLQDDNQNKNEIQKIKCEPVVNKDVVVISSEKQIDAISNDAIENLSYSNKQLSPEKVHHVLSDENKIATCLKQDDYLEPCCENIDRKDHKYDRLITERQNNERVKCKEVEEVEKQKSMQKTKPQVGKVKGNLILVEEDRNRVNQNRNDFVEAASNLKGEKLDGKIENTKIKSRQEIVGCDVTNREVSDVKIEKHQVENDPSKNNEKNQVHGNKILGEIKSVIQPSPTVKIQVQHTETPGRKHNVPKENRTASSSYTEKIIHIKQESKSFKEEFIDRGLFKLGKLFKSSKKDKSDEQAKKPAKIIEREKFELNDTAGGEVCRLDKFMSDKVRNCSDKCKENSINEQNYNIENINNDIKRSVVNDRPDETQKLIASAYDRKKENVKCDKSIINQNRLKEYPDRSKPANDINEQYENSRENKSFFLNEKLVQQNADQLQGKNTNAKIMSNVKNRDVKVVRFQDSVIDQSKARVVDKRVEKNKEIDINIIKEEVCEDSKSGGIKCSKTQPAGGQDDVNIFSRSTQQLGKVVTNGNINNEQNISLAKTVSYKVDPEMAKDINYQAIVKADQNRYDEKERYKENPGFSQVRKEENPGFGQMQIKKYTGFDQVQYKEIPGFGQVKSKEIQVLDQVQNKENPGFDQVQRKEIQGFGHVEIKENLGSKQVQHDNQDDNGTILKDSGFDLVQYVGSNKDQCKDLQDNIKCNLDTEIDTDRNRQESRDSDKDVSNVDLNSKGGKTDVEKFHDIQIDSNEIKNEIKDSVLILNNLDQRNPLIDPEESAVKIGSFGSGSNSSNQQKDCKSSEQNKSTAHGELSEQKLSNSVICKKIDSEDNYLPDPKVNTHNESDIKSKGSTEVKAVKTSSKCLVKTDNDSGDVNLGVKGLLFDKEDVSKITLVNTQEENNKSLSCQRGLIDNQESGSEVLPFTQIHTNNSEACESSSHDDMSVNPSQIVKNKIIVNKEKSSLAENAHRDSLNGNGNTRKAIIKSKPRLIRSRRPKSLDSGIDLAQFELDLIHRLISEHDKILYGAIKAGSAIRRKSHDNEAQRSRDQSVSDKLVDKDNKSSDRLCDILTSVPSSWIRARPFPSEFAKPPVPKNSPRTYHKKTATLSFLDPQSKNKLEETLELHLRKGPIFSDSETQNSFKQMHRPHSASGLVVRSRDSNDLDNMDLIPNPRRQRTHILDEAARANRRLQRAKNKEPQDPDGDVDFDELEQIFNQELQRLQACTVEDCLHKKEESPTFARKSFSSPVSQHGSIVADLDFRIDTSSPSEGLTQIRNNLQETRDMLEKMLKRTTPSRINNDKTEPP